MLTENTETLKIEKEGDSYNLIFIHDQSGSVHGIMISQSIYQQLKDHFLGKDSKNIVDGSQEFSDCLVEINKS